MPRHVILVGTSSSRDGAIAAAERDPTAETWGVSSRGAFPKADRWFEIHRIDGTFDKEGEAENWRATLRKQMLEPTPIPELWMIYPEYDLCENVKGGWHLKLEDRFGTYHMTSTFAWMMGQAIDEMAPVDPDGTRHFAERGSKISIYGVDMEYGTEYRQQRQGFRSFIKIAEQLGIDCHRVVSGGLLYEPIPYPMWQDDPLLCKIERRNSEARSTIVKLNESIRATREMIASTRGAIAEAEAMQTPPYDVAARLATLDSQVQALMGTSAIISKDLTAWDAVDQEQAYWRDYLQP